MKALLLFLLPLLLFAQADLKKLDAHLKQTLKDWDIPGFSVAIVKDGKVVFEKGYGTKHVNGGARVDEHTLYAIASNTKAFIAASIAVLVEQGKLDWNDRVISYLPYFKLYDDWVTQNVTIRDLLNHRVGLGTYSGDAIWYKTKFTAEETVKRARYVKQAYHFRDGYGYTNLMFITAGEVIQKVTGKKWSTFVRETFFNPLKMDDTITSTNDFNKQSNLATPHKIDIMTGQNVAIKWTNWDNMGAAGGIISSVHDMSKWLIMQLNGGEANGKRFFSQASQNQMWTARNAFTYNRQHKTMQFNGVGLGWFTNDYHGHKIVSHGGGYDGMYSQVKMVPKLNLGIVVLTNSMKGISTAITGHIIDQYLGRTDTDWNSDYIKRQNVATKRWAKWVKSYQTKRMGTAKTTVPMAQLTGTYDSPMYTKVEILPGKNGLVMNIPGAPALGASLTHWHGNTYQTKWNETHAWFDFGLIQFQTNAKGEVTGLHMDVPNYDIFFHEIEFTKKK